FSSLIWPYSPGRDDPAMVSADCVNDGHEPSVDRTGRSSPCLVMFRSGTVPVYAHLVQEHQGGITKPDSVFLPVDHCLVEIPVESLRRIILLRNILHCSTPRNIITIKTSSQRRASYADR